MLKKFTLTESRERGFSYNSLQNKAHARRLFVELLLFIYLRNTAVLPWNVQTNEFN